MTIAKASNGLSIVSQHNCLVLCWDCDPEIPAGLGSCRGEATHLSCDELSQLMVSAEDWQATHDSLRSESLYQEVSALMQIFKGLLQEMRAPMFNTQKQRIGWNPRRSVQI